MGEPVWENQAVIPPRVLHDVPLAPLTTLELGGPARALVEVEDEGDLVEALRWAAAEGLPVAVLGGGSNVVVADAGFPGLVVRMATRGIEVRAGRGDEAVRLTAAAGESWDDLVAAAVDEGLAGIECLAGIPGTVGATPVQNVGAYGQEVAETIVAIRALDRRDLTVRTLQPDECGFGYRASVFRRRPDRWVILAVMLRLRQGGAGEVRSPELARALGCPAATPEVATVRDAVLELRRQKSMVIDREDENRRSAGSFFVNPVLDAGAAAAVARRAVAAGLAGSIAEVPAFPLVGGLVKLSAAWLVERAGFPKGTRRGPVGVSSRHALALVHHGGGSAAELLAFAGEITAAVETRFGVRLEREPVLLGAPDAGPR